MFGEYDDYLESKMYALEDDLADAQYDLDIAKATIRDLENKLHSAQTEMDNVLQELQEKTNLIAELKAQLQVLHEQG